MTVEKTEFEERRKRTRGRPKLDDTSPRKVRRDWCVVQIRLYPDAMRRFDNSMALCGFISRAEFARVLIDEALKAKGL